MENRRLEPRMLCADLVSVEWKDTSGHRRQGVVNLEDISLSGACLQFESPIPLGTAVKIHCPSGLLAGEVRYCLFREVGYYVGVQFNRGCKWSNRQFRPRHMLDPRRLLARALSRADRRIQ